MSNFKHGAASAKATPEYNSWRNMKARCHNPSHNRYHDYGGRGITVCDKWSDSFAVFLEDMGEKPTPTHSIDRIDNEGSYKPDNCRWATPTEQNRNHRIRKNNSSGISGVSRYRNNKWYVRIKVCGEEVHLGYTKDFFEACCQRKSAENKYWKCAA
jgi:hypothetical protein